MSTKRRDNKNRILRNGESQRKDGRYSFKYIDGSGTARFVYSWKLEKNDKVPAGNEMDFRSEKKRNPFSETLMI